MTEVWGLDDTWSLLSPSDDADVDAPQCIALGARFLDATLTINPANGIAHVVRARNSERVADVAFRSIPAADGAEVRAAADAAVIAMGGAGFEVLVARTQRIWQVRAVPLRGPEACGPAVLVAVLAMRFTAPVLMPRGERLFGVKGTRGWLADHGWT